MVVILYVLLVLYYLLSPIPPLFQLPRPLHLHRVDVALRKVPGQGTAQTDSGREQDSLSTIVSTTVTMTVTTIVSATVSTTVQSLEQTSIQLISLEQEQPLQQLYTRVAARSLGEGAFALPEIACTIKNRLQNSRASLTSVLRAYRARDVPPQPQQVEVVRQVFEGELPCPATWWYAISLQDTKHWRPHRRAPAKIVEFNKRKQIWIFDR